MKPLTANLKNLYQCRYIWMFHLMLIFGILGMVISCYQPGTDIPFMGLSLIIIAVYGEGIAFIAGGILTKPFGFCLPGHIKTAQEMIFLIWGLYLA